MADTLVDTLRSSVRHKTTISKLIIRINSALVHCETSTMTLEAPAATCYRSLQPCLGGLACTCTLARPPYSSGHHWLWATEFPGRQIIITDQTSLLTEYPSYGYAAATRPAGPTLSARPDCLSAQKKASSDETDFS